MLAANAASRPAPALTWKMASRRTSGSGSCRAREGGRLLNLRPLAAASCLLTTRRRSHRRCSPLLSHSALPAAGDSESLRWSLELALIAEDYEEAAILQRAIALSDVTKPVSALQGIVRDRVQGALCIALDALKGITERIKAVRQLQEFATAPSSSLDAEDALHCILQKVQNNQLAERAEGALWSAWLRSGDEVVDEMMQRGIRCLGAGELEEATEIFTQVVNAAPHFAEGWNKRATAHFLANRVEECIEDCRQVLALKPRHFGCLSGLGICHLRKGDERTATAWLRKSLEVNPRSDDMQRIVASLEARRAEKSSGKTGSESA